MEGNQDFDETLISNLPFHKWNVDICGQRQIQKRKEKSQILRNKLINGKKSF